MRKHYFLLLCLLVVIPQLTFAQRKVNVIDILDNPGEYLDETVEVQGTITQFIPAPSTSLSHYVLQGRFGGTIRVKTPSAEPEINRTHVITGTVYSENGIPYIHEDRKYCVDCATNGPPPPTDNTLLYIIIIAIIALIGVAVLYFINQKKAVSSGPAFDPGPPAIPGASPETVKPDVSTMREDDFSTIKINFSGGDLKTMKFIPGKLELISGADKGKTFMFAGYPTEKGSEVTIGREKIEGERASSHIQIDPQFQTVSRKQALLRYRNGKLYVKNLSQTNPTELNGERLQAGEEKEMEFGAKLRTGELEFKYIQ
jgi:hypothetical protein